MQQLLLTVVASLCLLQTVAALQCKTCIQYSFDADTDNDMLKSMLDTMKAAGDANCKNNANSVTSMTCPAASSGMKMVCASSSITVKFEMEAADFSMDMGLDIRGCEDVKRDTDTSVSACEPIDKEWLKKHMEGGEQGAGDGGMTNMFKDVSGKMCICGDSDCNSAVAQTAGSDVTVSSMAVLFTCLLTCLTAVLV